MKTKQKLVSDIMHVILQKYGSINALLPQSIITYLKNAISGNR